MGHDIELDDSHAQSKTHHAAVIIPAVLSIAEKENSNGKELMLSTVVAYDVECRMSVALGAGWHLARNFHPTSVCGCFGAAVATGKILKLRKDQFLDTLGLAGCQASGLESWQTEIGHMTKSFHTGLSARNGIVTALLADKGYHGPPAIFDGPYNVFEAFAAGKENPEELTKKLGTKFDIIDTGFKIYSSCRVTHAPLDAFFMLMRKYKLSSDNIREATVKVPAAALGQINGNELLTHNMQYVLAVAAVNGKITSDQFHKKSTDPRVLDLAKRVKVIAEPKLEKSVATKRSGIVDVITKDGKKLVQRVDDAVGEPANPVSQAQLEEKFTDLAEAVLPKRQVGKILEAVREAQAAGEVSSRDEALIYAKKLIDNKSS